MKPWAESFYKSTAWKRTRFALLVDRNFTCERCGRRASMVHHKRYLTENNIGDPEITLGFDNLEALCETCHQNEHHKGDGVPEGLYFDADGMLHPVDDGPGSAPR